MNAEERKAELERMLLITLRSVAVKLNRAIDAAEKGRNCFDLTGGPNAALPGLLEAQSLADKIDFIDNFVLDT